MQEHSCGTDSTLREVPQRASACDTRGRMSVSYSHNALDDSLLLARALMHCTALGCIKAHSSVACGTCDTRHQLQRVTLGHIARVLGAHIASRRHGGEHTRARHGHMQRRALKHRRERTVFICPASQKPLEDHVS